MKKKLRLSAVGVSSLLVIFAVLCLTVFAILAVSTVEAQLRLADSTRAAVTDYYAADCRAEEILAKLRSGALPDSVTKEGDIYSYVCPISETQQLKVRVRITGDHYTILQWQTVSTAEWDIDNKLPVWDGQQP